MNNLFHSAQAARVCDTLGAPFEILTKLSRKRDRAAQQIISFSSAIQPDSAEDVIDGLLLESWNAHKLVGLADRFEIFDRFDAKSIVDFLRRLRADTRNLDDLRQSQRDFLLQLFMKFDGARSKILIDFARQVAADTRNVMQPSLL